ARSAPPSRWSGCSAAPRWRCPRRAGCSRPPRPRSATSSWSRTCGTPATTCSTTTPPTAGWPTGSAPTSPHCRRRRGRWWSGPAGAPPRPVRAADLAQGLAVLGGTGGDDARRRVTRLLAVLADRPYARVGPEGLAVSAFLARALERRYPDRALREKYGRVWEEAANRGRMTSMGASR